MTSILFSRGLQLDPIAKRPPEALVILLPDLGPRAATLTPVAVRWASTVTTTRFIVLDGPEQFHSPPSCLPWHRALDLDSAVEPAALDRAAGQLKPQIEAQLRSCGLNASRLVLVGFGYSGALALHMALRQGWSCAGVLAFAAKPMRPLPRIVRVGQKVRLIVCAEEDHIGHGSLRDVVASLTGRGIDARGVLLAGSVFSDEAIRHGAAYLVELVATAQWSACWPASVAAR
jgi:predicted esterase